MSHIRKHLVFLKKDLLATISDVTTNRFVVKRSITLWWLKELRNFSQEAKYTLLRETDYSDTIAQAQSIIFCAMLGEGRGVRFTIEDLNSLILLTNKLIKHANWYINLPDDIPLNVPVLVDEEV